MFLEIFSKLLLIIPIPWADLFLLFLYLNIRINNNVRCLKSFLSVFLIIIVPILLKRLKNIKASTHYTRSRIYISYGENLSSTLTFRLTPPFSLLFSSLSFYPHILSSETLMFSRSVHSESFHSFWGRLGCLKTKLEN